MKGPIKYGRLWRLLACMSIAMNLLVGIILYPKVVNKLKTWMTSHGGGVEIGYNFRSNSYYDTYLTTFQLNHGTADIVFLGDSITLGGMWNEFFPDTNILNRGIGSDTSEGVLNRIDEVVTHEPNKIFLMIGCNDIARNIPQEKIVNNVKAILKETENKLPQCEIYLQSLLPSDLDKNKVISLNDAYRNLAEEYNNCSYVDLYSLFLNSDGSTRKECFGIDNVHLKGEGYTVWIDAISEFVY